MFTSAQIVNLNSIQSPVLPEIQSEVCCISQAEAVNLFLSLFLDFVTCDCVNCDLSRTTIL